MYGNGLMGVPAVSGIGKTGNLPIVVMRIVPPNIGGVPNGTIMSVQTNYLATTAVLKVMENNSVYI